MCVYPFITFVSCFVYFLVCWVRENFSGGPGHIFPVWDSVVWSAGPVQFFSGFPGYKAQSTLSFLKGRSSRFLRYYAVCSIMSRQEIFLYLTSVWLRFVFIRFYKASGFSNIFGYYCEHCLLCGEDFSLFFVTS